MIQGVTQSNKLVSILCNDDGTLKVDGGNGNSAPRTRTAKLLNVSDADSIPAGACSVGIENNGDSNGIVSGVFLPPGASVSWTTTGYDTLNAVSYDATWTQFLITVLV